jgi:hypothetical protein
MANTNASILLFLSFRLIKGGADGLTLEKARYKQVSEPVRLLFFSKG